MELYDNDWTDAYDELMTLKKEEKQIAALHWIIMV
jgi:hypothetical protein